MLYPPSSPPSPPSKPPYSPVVQTPPSKPPYSPSRKGYGYSTSPYYPYYEYPSSPYSNLIDPPPEEFLFFPMWGTKVRGAGKRPPYKVRYDDELEAVKRMRGGWM